MEVGVPPRRELSEKAVIVQTRYRRRKGNHESLQKLRRVAQERRCAVGAEVGYAVRF